MKRGKVLIALLILGAIPTDINAAVAPAARAVVELGVDKNTWETRTGRDKLVDALRAYCDAIDAGLPRNSPAEDSWVRGELSAGPPRAFAVEGTREFGRLIISTVVENCKTYVGIYKRQPVSALIGLGETFTDLHNRIANDEHFEKRIGLSDDEGYLLSFGSREIGSTLLSAARFASFEADRVQVFTSRPR